MAQGNNVTLVGNITDDPELRYTPSGTPVASFTIAINRRFRDPATNEWKDGETSFFRCNIWRQQAENVAESLTKGTRVIVSGRIKTRSWETQDGQKRTVAEIDVDSCGPSLEWAKAVVTKTPRSEGVPAYAGAPAGGNGSSEIDEEPPF
jgi:single-strand DNA-binding protein